MNTHTVSLCVQLLKLKLIITDAKTKGRKKFLAKITGPLEQNWQKLQ